MQDAPGPPDDAAPADDDWDDDWDDAPDAAEVTIPALEVRLPDDVLLIVDGVGHDGYTVVHGDPESGDFTELADVHDTFIDAVEYVAAAAEPASGNLPVVDVSDDFEAVAIYDAIGGLYAITKSAPTEYSLWWVDDDGEAEVVDRYGTLREALLLPVLDETLFGE